MNKQKLNENVHAVLDETKTALQTIWSNVNKGQQKQIRKIPECETLLERYGIED